MCREIGCQLVTAKGKFVKRTNLQSAIMLCETEVDDKDAVSKLTTVSEEFFRKLSPDIFAKRV